MPKDTIYAEGQQIYIPWHLYGEGRRWIGGIRPTLRADGKLVGIFACPLGTKFYVGAHLIHVDDRVYEQNTRCEQPVCLAVPLAEGGPRRVDSGSKVWFRYEHPSRKVKKTSMTCIKKISSIGGHAYRLGQSRIVDFKYDAETTTEDANIVMSSLFIA